MEKKIKIINQQPYSLSLGGVWHKPGGGPSLPEAEAISRAENDPHLWALEVPEKKSKRSKGSGE